MQAVRSRLGECRCPRPGRRALVWEFVARYPDEPEAATKKTEALDDARPAPLPSRRTGDAMGITETHATRPLPWSQELIVSSRMNVTFRTTL
jgi:hypothetical protein